MRRVSTTLSPIVAFALFAAMAITTLATTPEKRGPPLEDLLRIDQAGVPMWSPDNVGEGHGFRHTGSLRDLHGRVEAFLTKYNRPPATSSQ